MLKSRITLLYFGTAIAAGIFVACSGNAADKKPVDQVLAESGDDITSREKSYFRLDNKSPYSKSVITAYKGIRKAGRHIDYFTNTGKQLLFLSSKKSMLDHTYDSKGQLFGLIDGDADGKTLLPVEYEKIGNPGMIAGDYVEIKKNGKYGLYNYVNQTIIDPQYDVLFPSAIMGYVAIGERSSKLYRVYADGSEKPFTDDMPVPDYASLISEFDLHAEKPTFAYWISTEPIQINDYELIFDGGALIQMPSWMDYLRIMPETANEINMPWVELGTEDMSIKLQEERKRTNEITSYITSFFHTIGESRPTEINKRNLVTVDKRNRVRSRTKLLEWGEYTLMDYWTSDGNDKYSEEGPLKARFLNDSVVEVTDFASYEGDAIPYSQYTKLSYFIVHKDGSVSKPAKGLFPMASAIELKPQHFKGCFIRELRDDEEATAVVSDEWEDYGYESLLSITRHLSAADLDYMEMEIYARHGLKFSDVKWKGVFANVSWYKPTVSYEKMQKRLTSIERKNIAFLQQLRRQINANPDAYLYEEIRPHVVAG